MAKGIKTGGGSRAGIPNKVTKELREMILGALDDAGGQTYLYQQALDEPKAFLALIAKVIPREVENKISGDLSIKTITRQIIDAKHSD
ncbi:MAG: hypothetical protein WCW84_13130 [Sulfurimonas sp.]|jgi:hypothetical protein